MEQKIGMFGTNQTWRRGVKTPTKHEQMCTKSSDYAASLKPSGELGSGGQLVAFKGPKGTGRRDISPFGGGGSW